MNQPSGGSVLPTFSTLSLPKSIVSTLAEQGIVNPSPVQLAVIPDALAGRDVLGRAQTGSGKTLSFGLPVLARLAGTTSAPKAPRGLILLPTRELASQVAEVMQPMAKKLGLRVTTVYGGVSMQRQIQALRQGVDIVIATPGRLIDLLDRRCVRLDDVQITVLDEADHLCDLGFFKPVDRIVSLTPEGSQRILLSATLDGDVDKIVRKHLPRHARHDIAGEPVTMDHHVVVADQADRGEVARRILSANPRTIVFVRTRRGAMRLAKQLTRDGIESVDMHGDLSQRHRERNLARFSSGEATVIVATDVAARGIHVDGIGLVMHFDAPAEHKAYLHRSGRTARAGEAGTVITLATPETVREVVTLQNKAGVTARHHKASQLPQPTTAESLAGAGTAAPEVGGGHGARRSGGAPRRGGQGQSRSGQGQSRGGQPRSQGHGGGQGRGGQSRGQGRPQGGGNRSRSNSRGRSASRAGSAQSS